MADKLTRETPINRRDFLRIGGAVGAGLRMALNASKTSAASGSPVSQRRSGSKVKVGTVPETAIKDLRKKLGAESKVLAPQDTGYAKRGLPANGRYSDIRPGAIAICKNASDVAICVEWCSKHDISPVARGGGHSYAGYSTTTGLLIDIGSLNSVEVNNDKGTAIVGGAALNRHVFDKTKDGKYFLPAGTCLAVGVGGLVLGGGIGYNSRSSGLTCDRLVSTRIVTASGHELEASSEENADLFWACRGGAGGSFGINTSFTFNLVEVPKDKVTYFQLEWRGADAAHKVFLEFNDLMATRESRLNATARAEASPLEGRSKRDAIRVVTRGQFIGEQPELMRLLGKFPAPQGIMPIFDEVPFWTAATRFTNESGKSHSFGDISRYAKDPVPDTAIRKQIDLLVNCPSRTPTANGSMWSLGWVGGDVINNVGRTETAYVHRGMSTLLRPTCEWPDDASQSVGDELMSWTDEMVAAIATDTPNESYQNFPNRRIKDWKEQYYAENLTKLIDIKTKYDKNNLFKNAQSIPTKQG
jgi:FAD/FMN-containing dehydrogenase